MLWELIGLLGDLHKGAYQKRAFEVNNFFWRSKDLLGVLMQQLGETWEDNFFPSRLCSERVAMVMQEGVAVRLVGKSGHARPRVC